MNSHLYSDHKEKDGCGCVNKRANLTEAPHGIGTADGFLTKDGHITLLLMGSSEILGIAALDGTSVKLSGVILVACF